MPSIEERVAYVEGRLEDHTGTVSHLRTDVRELRDQMDRRFDALDQKVDRHFTWTVGIQVAVLVAIVGTLVGSLYK